MGQDGLLTQARVSCGVQPWHQLGQYFNNVNFFQPSMMKSPGGSMGNTIETAGFL